MNELFKRLQLLIAGLYQKSASQIQREFAGEPWPIADESSFISFVILTATQAEAIRQSQNQPRRDTSFGNNFMNLYKFSAAYL